MTDIPSLAFNLKSSSNENIILKSFKKQKEQSQKELSINLLRNKLKQFSSEFRLQDISNLADTMVNLPTIKMNIFHSHVCCHATS